MTKLKERRQELVLNRGTEIMLPRSRRVEEPSWFDRTFRLLNRVVRVRIDVRKES